MLAKNEFLLSAIEDARETIHFLETKAGVLVASESLLFGFTINCMKESGSYNLANSGDVIFRMALFIFTIVCALLLLGLVFYTLKAIVPCDCVDSKINFDGHEPKRLFFLDKLDKHGKLAKPFFEYENELLQMDEVAVAQEYIYELLKLSYIRKAKSVKISTSLHWLLVMILLVVVLGFWSMPYKT